jgi:di/tricarboxylate transporter
MNAELILLLGLVVVFVVPVATDLNVGVVAFVVALLTGTLLLDSSVNEIMAGFPGQMFILMVGITLLLAIAQHNGTADWIVQKIMALAGGRLILLPWVLFFTAFITSSLGPGAAPLLFVIGVGFIKKFELNPLLVAAMIIHGTQSGAYSPIAPYGVVIRQLAEDSMITYSASHVFVGVVAFHLALAFAVFFGLGGYRLKGQRFTNDGLEQVETSTLNTERCLTLGGFAALIVAVVFFSVHLGFAAMVIAFCLLLVTEKSERSEAINRVAWPIVLVISGVLTYVNLIQEAGAIGWLAAQVSNAGSANLIGLLLCLLVAVITGVASTIGTIGMLIPLSAPFIVSGELDGTGLLTAMAISAAVTDISPFSTWGALFLATAASVVDKEKMLKSQLLYTAVVLCTLPALAWIIFVVF